MPLGRVQGLSMCEEAGMEKPCVARTQGEEITWVGKGCSAQCRVADGYGYLSSSLISTALPPASSSGISADVTAEEPLELPNINCVVQARNSQAGLSFQSRLLRLHTESAVWCSQPCQTTFKLTTIYPNLSINLPTLSDAVLSPEVHPCGSSLDTEALALKCSERHLAPSHVPREDQFLHA